jgi:adenylate cyclase
VLEGDLQKSGNEIRVTARLIEIESSVAIWSRRYHRTLRDTSSAFVLQHEIAEAVVATTDQNHLAMVSTIGVVERRRANRIPSASRNAWQAYQFGLSQIAKVMSVNNALALAEESFKQAIKLDPEFAGGYRGLALVHIHAGITLARRPDLVELELAAEWARKALDRDPTDVEARTSLANALGVQGDHEAAIIEAKRALERSPHFAAAHGVLGAALTFSGKPEEGLSSLLLSITLDPEDAMSPARMLQVAVAYYLCGNYEATVDAARQVTRLHPKSHLIFRWLAAALGQMGRISEAGEALAKAKSANLEAYESFGEQPPWMRSGDFAQLLDGLHKAGWHV